jgi:hypothetical protein
MKEYERWLHETDHHLFRIAGGVHRSLRVSAEQMRDYHDRHEAPEDAALAILLDLDFPTELLAERSKRQ